MEDLRKQKIIEDLEARLEQSENMRKEEKVILLLFYLSFFSS